MIAEENWQKQILDSGFSVTEYQGVSALGETKEETWASSSREGGGIHIAKPKDVMENT